MMSSFCNGLNIGPRFSLQIVDSMLVVHADK